MEQGDPLTRLADWAKETTEALCVHAEGTSRAALQLKEQNTTRDMGRTEGHRRCARVSLGHRQAPTPRPRGKVPRARLHRSTRYGHRVMTAALTLHDDEFPDAYLAAAWTTLDLSAPRANQP